MKNKILVLILYFLMNINVAFVSAQIDTARYNMPFISGALAGKVTDLNNNEIPGVDVKIMTFGWKKKVLQTKTDGSGNFSFNNFIKGIYYLKFEYPAFNPIEIKIKLKKGLKTKLKFQLIPSA